MKILRISLLFFFFWSISESRKVHSYYGLNCVADYLSGLNKPLHTPTTKKHKTCIDKYRFLVFVHNFPPTKKRLDQMFLSIQNKSENSVSVYDAIDHSITVFPSLKTQKLQIIHFLEDDVCVTRMKAAYRMFLRHNLGYSKIVKVY